MVDILVKDAKYNGKCVAMKDFGDKEIVGDGNTPSEAYEKAIAKGCKEPVIVFVPSKDSIQIY